MRSMTGFGRGISHSQGISLETTIRTLNNRYCQIKMKLSPELYELENEIRDRIQERISRGIVEVSMKLEYPLTDLSRLKVDHVLAREYVYNLQKMKSKIDLPGLNLDPSIRLDALLQIEPIWNLQTPELHLEELRACLLQSLGTALDGVSEMRDSEGDKLKTIISNLLEEVNGVIPQIEQLAGVQDELIYKRLRQRVEERFPDLNFSDNRLREEVHYYCERSDITEEVERLKAHLGAAFTMIGEAVPIGRKFEFLVQEMHREANTLGVKAASAAISSHVIFLKTQLDRIKEQILNIE